MDISFASPHSLLLHFAPLEMSNAHITSSIPSKLYNFLVRVLLEFHMDIYYLYKHKQTNFPKNEIVLNEVGQTIFFLDISKVYFEEWRRDDG